MKEVKQAIVLVDDHRRSSRQRNTAGRYRVGAKTEKEAVKLVQDAIGFGSVKFWYFEPTDSTNKKVGYKEVVKEVWATNNPAETKFKYEQPVHATASHKN